MNDDSRHLLVVDDDERLRRLLVKYLGENGYMVAAAANAAEARTQLAAIAFDLIVLDVMMPGESGLDLARSIRQENPVPILLLTAMGETNDRIIGLETGADDYLTKPFDPKELLLRIGGILRRAHREEPRKEMSDECRFGRFVFFISRQELRDGETPVHLTTAEAALLAILASRAGEILSRDELAAKAGETANPRTIDVQVTRLRRKIEDDPRQPRHLQTMRGQGYVLWPNR